MKTIKQFISEHLIKTEIFEMAKTLDQYKSIIESQIPMLIAHIILVMKSRKENSDEYISHWKKEIGGFMRNCINFRLKTKDTYNSRYKHIYDVYINQLELDSNDDFIIGKIWNKCFEEGYDFDNKQVYDEFIDLVHEFQDNYLDEIIDVIASNDFAKITNFINKL